MVVLCDSSRTPFIRGQWTEESKVRDGRVLRGAQYHSCARRFQAATGSTLALMSKVRLRCGFLVTVLWIVWMEMYFAVTVASLKRHTRQTWRRSEQMGVRAKGLLDEKVSS